MKEPAVDARIGIDIDDPTPTFEQIRRQIINHIASGALPVGAKLPPLRQLARDLGIAVGTAAHAYQLLEQAGVITTRRGAGTRVAGPASTGVEMFPQNDRRLQQLAVEYLTAAAELGASASAALGAIVRETQRADRRDQ